MIWFSSGIMLGLSLGFNLVRSSDWYESVVIYIYER